MPDNPMPSSLEFDYVKSNFFRVIRVNGAFGGIGPDGNLFMAVFSERPPLPDVTFQAVDSTGKVGAELMEQRKVTSKGIVRELEAGLSMDVNTARAIIQWLTERVGIAEKLATDAQARIEVKQ
jgi:hypothetical protein